MKTTKTLIKNKDEFVDFAKEHTIPEIAENFGLDITYVKNYIGNHKIPHKNLDMWHGMSGKRLYTIYRGMIARCYNPNHIHYDLYGGRGITVCKEWKEDKKKFFSWAVDNGYSDELQLDRIDGDKGYEPSNCRFVSNLENQNNRRCTVKYEGIAVGIIANDKACNPLGLEEYIIYKRLTGDNGRLKKWDILTALATPKTNIKGSHKILPVREDLVDSIVEGLKKYNILLTND